MWVSVGYVGIIGVYEGLLWVYGVYWWYIGGLCGIYEGLLRVLSVYGGLWGYMLVSGGSL